MRVQLGQKNIAWRDKNEVEESMKVLMDWLEQPSPLRKAMKTLQLGGLFYCTHVDLLCMNAFILCGDGKASMVEDAVARLCQAKAMGPGTKITFG